LDIELGWVVYTAGGRPLLKLSSVVAALARSHFYGNILQSTTLLTR
jgi:hypothetical protein